MRLPGGAGSIPALADRAATSSVLRRVARACAAPRPPAPCTYTISSSANATPSLTSTDCGVIARLFARRPGRVQQVPFLSASFWQGLQFAVQIHRSGSTCNCFGRWNFVAARTFIDGGVRRCLLLRWCARSHLALLDGVGRGRSDGPRTRPVALRPAAAVLPMYAHMSLFDTQQP